MRGNLGAYKVMAVSASCSSAVSNVFNVLGISNLGQANLTEVYPNPFTDGYTIRFNTSESESALVTMQDELGRVVHAQAIAIQNGQLQIYPGPLAAGVYLLQLTTDKTVINKKLVKE